MAISIFGINDSSNWVKKISWRGVSFVVACVCAVVLFVPDCILRRIELACVIETNTRRWVGLLFVVSLFAFIYCVRMSVASGLKRWIESRQWRGKHATDKIKRLSIQAQEEVREHVNGESFQLYNDGEIYKELLGGNLIEIVPPKDELMVNCRLKKWVLECFKRYPNLVNELHEMDAAIREAHQNLP